ncbi:TPA: hypothetical protein RQK06_004539 [Vibrio vulnificus]|nr:hypothetical protein [Vibrio vulnificus]
MTNSSFTTQNTTNLQTDTTNIALMVLHERLVDLERQIGLERNDARKLELAVEHRELLDLYQLEIQRCEDYNPLSTPYDW